MARNPADRWLAAYSGEKFIKLDEFQHAVRRHLINRAATSDPADPMSGPHHLSEVP
jgi:hypothetical protein